jgi:hypothetical protein
MPLEDGIENHCVIAAVVNTWPQGVTVAFVSVISSLVIGQTSFFLIASARTIFVIWGGREATGTGEATGEATGAGAYRGAIGIELSTYAGAGISNVFSSLLGSLV